MKTVKKLLLGILAVAGLIFAQQGQAVVLNIPLTNNTPSSLYASLWSRTNGNYTFTGWQYMAGNTQTVFTVGGGTSWSGFAIQLSTLPYARLITASAGGDVHTLMQSNAVLVYGAVGSVSASTNGAGGGNPVAHVFNPYVLIDTNGDIVNPTNGGHLLTPSYLLTLPAGYGQTILALNSSGSLVDPTNVFTALTVSNYPNAPVGLSATTNGDTITLVLGTAAFYVTNTAAVAAPPAAYGALENSNSVLFWVTANKTNLVSDGR